MPFKTVKEIAEELRVNVVTVKRLIYAGKLKAKKVGSRWRISEEDYQKYLKEDK